MIVDNSLFGLPLYAVNSNTIFHGNIIAVDIPEKVARIIATMITYNYCSLLNFIDPTRISMYTELSVNILPRKLFCLAVDHRAFATPRTSLARLCFEGRCSDCTDRQYQQDE